MPFQRHLRLLLLLPLAALAALAALAGCSDSPNAPAVNQTIPLGRWKQVRFVNDGVRTLKVESRLDLVSQTKGSMRDSIYHSDGSAWVLDSVSEISLSFAMVGDGYQRTTEIRTAGGVIDTTVGYWYFFKRGGMLLYYRGMRFLGKGSGLAGQWNSDPSDTDISRRSYSIEFKGGHVRFEAMGKNATAPVELPYVVSGDTLNVGGSGLPFGDRYEVFPGWALYLTNHTSEGYSPS